MFKAVIVIISILLTTNSHASEKDEICLFFSNDFKSSRAQLSKPKILSSTKVSEDYYVCAVRFELKKLHYSMPIIVQLDVNPKTFVYEFKEL